MYRDDTKNKMNLPEEIKEQLDKLGFKERNLRGGKQRILRLSESHYISVEENGNSLEILVSDGNSVYTVEDLNYEKLVHLVLSLFILSKSLKKVKDRPYTNMDFHIESATKQVSKWPKWKQNLLENSMKGICQNDD